MNIYGRQGAMTEDIKVEMKSYVYFAIVLKTKKEDMRNKNILLKSK